MSVKNIKKGIITTIIGSLILTSDVAIVIMSIIKWDFNGSIMAFLVTTILLGVGLLFSPDTILKKLDKTDKI